MCHFLGNIAISRLDNIESTLYIDYEYMNNSIFSRNKKYVKKYVKTVCQICKL